MTLENRVVNGEKRMVQAMLNKLEYFDGLADGKGSQQFYEALVKIKSAVGAPIRKANETIMVTPNGLIIQELRKSAPKVNSKFGDMKLVGLTGEVIHCTDANWKLNIIAADKMPLPKVEGKTSEEAINLHRIISAIYKETKLPFHLSEKDFTKQENGKWQFTLRLPHIKWLQNDCSFTAPIPTAISAYIVKQLASIGFMAQEKASSFVVTWDGAASQRSKNTLTQFKGTNIWFIITNTDHYVRDGDHKLSKELKAALIKEIDYIYEKYGIPITIDAEDISLIKGGRDKDRYSFALQVGGTQWSNKRTGQMSEVMPTLIAKKLKSKLKNKQWTLGEGNELTLMSGKGYTLFLVARTNVGKDSYGDGSIPGHVFVGGINKNGNEEAYGFYPNTDEGNIIDTLSETSEDRVIPDVSRLGLQGPTIRKKKLLGLVKDDTTWFKRALKGDDRFRFMHFTVTEQQYNTALRSMKSYALNYDYGLFNRSCIHAAFDVLFKAGIAKSEYKRTAATPDALYLALPANKGYNK